MFINHVVVTYFASGDKFKVVFCYRAGRYEVDGYVYNAAEEPKMLMTGKWNESMNYQPCDMEGEPLPGTELKEVLIVYLCRIFLSVTFQLQMRNCILRVKLHLVFLWRAFQYCRIV